MSRLRDRISDHEHERNVVAGDAECADTVVAQILHENPVPDEHQHGQRAFGQQSGRADAALVAYITDRQAQTFRAPLDRIQAEPVGEAPQVDNSDQPADKQPDRRGERGSIYHPYHATRGSEVAKRKKLFQPEYR